MRYAGQVDAHARRGRKLLVLFGLTVVVIAFVGGVYFQREGYSHELRDKVTGLPRILRGILDPPELPTILVDIKFKHYLDLKAQRDAAVARGILFADEDDFVPATMTCGAQKFDVKLRLKGDWVDHLEGEDWSFRVKLDQDDALFGMRVFSLQHPRLREWDGEWLYHQHLRHEGVLALRYLPVRFVLNGKDHGVYVIEEHFSRELLESQARRESVIVKFDETSMWERMDVTRPPFENQLKPADHHVERLDVFQAARLDASPVLANQRSAALALIRAWRDGDLAPSQVFKVEELARYLAVSEVWNAFHAMTWHNVRFYYDPVVARLEPIGFDASPSDERHDELCALVDVWTQDVLRDPAIASAFMAALERLLAPGYLEVLQRELLAEWQELLRAFWVDSPSFESAAWQRVAAKLAYLRGVIETSDLALVELVDVATNAGDGALARVRIGNTARLPLELRAIRIDGVDVGVPGLPARLDCRSGRDPMRWRTFPLPAILDPAAKLTVEVALVGRAKSQTIAAQRCTGSLVLATAVQSALTLEQFLDAHPFVSYDAETHVLRVAPGEWQIESDLVVPAGFTLELGAGVVLRFAPDAVLLARGAALRFDGAADAPIRLLPRAETWPGVIVINAPPSTWRYVEVERTQALDRAGWTVLGGVTFCDSPVRFERCVFRDNRCEDAVNVVRSEVAIHECLFAGTPSDAFDGDFARGRITDSRFEDIGGDGIDVSGSELVIERVTLRDLHDKGISAGEASHVQATHVAIERTRFGAVSKDHSTLDVDDFTVKDARCALATYVKKVEYGEAQLHARAVHVERVDRLALAQLGCRLSIDGVPVASEAVDVDALYASGGKATVRSKTAATP
ncbi:MAG: hypothetical protein ACKVX7_20565 [Planctomycetota bacterium]